MKSKNKTIVFSLACGVLFACGQSIKPNEKALFSENRQIIDASKTVVHGSENDPQTIEFEDQSTYKYSVSLPAIWKVEAMNEETLDYCNYQARLSDGTKVLEMNALLNTRFDEDNIQDLYTGALKTTQLKITYKLLKGNWFVISGIDNKTGNIVYLKRVLGEQFVSDLVFDYPKSKESQVAPYIGRIAKSFDSM